MKFCLCFLGIVLNTLWLFAGNLNYDWTRQAKNIIAKMTVEEKISQMMNESDGIEHLGILPYNWWNEALHGVARNGRATVFPQPINMAATFDDDMVYRIASAIADEARAKFKISQRNKSYGSNAGLTYWAPNVNIFRDPRWGRGMETYGEDPYLSGVMGSAFVKGLQGNDDKYLKAAACVKHFAVHSGPEALRHKFNAIVSDKDLFETYLPAFQKVIMESNVEAVMGAYNSVNGQSASAHPRLLIDILREKWGFKGHVVSDCGAVTDIFSGHKIVKSEAEAAALAIKNGLNLECGSSFFALKEALDRKLITEREIDNALLPLIVTKLKLGLIGKANDNPFADIHDSVVCSKEHIQLALAAAEKSFVLLKNTNETLPLKKNTKFIYVTGPFATDGNVLLGNYYGIPSKIVTYLEGISSAVSLGTKVNYKSGILQTVKNSNPIDWVTGETKKADVTIVFLGESNLTEGEEGDAIASIEKGDRIDLKLPRHQIEFLRKIRNKTTNKIITVVSCGGPFESKEICKLSDAVIWAGYPGQEAGEALAKVLFGDVSPSGRLPVTFPDSVGVLPDFTDYSMEGRTYKYQKKGIAFPFGYGLTYSKVIYKGLNVDNVKGIGKKNIKLSFTIKNVGEYEIEDVPQLYLISPKAGKEMPLSSLIGFKRIKIMPNEEKVVDFIITPQMLQMVDWDGGKVILKGDYKLVVSTSAPCEKTLELGGILLKYDFVLN